MKAKMDKFNKIWDELGSACRCLHVRVASNECKYSDPDGGYFVVVNCAKVQLPDGYSFPPHVAKAPQRLQAGVLPHPRARRWQRFRRPSFLRQKMPTS